MTTDRTGAVSKALGAMRAIAESSDPITVTGLAKTIGVPASTAHRLLHQLIAEGMVSYLKDSRRYSVGVEYLRVASLVSARYDIARIAEPIMQRVVDDCEETCLLGLYREHECDMMWVRQVESKHGLRFHFPMHQPQPLVWGSSGRVILAHLPEVLVPRAVQLAGPLPTTGEDPPDAHQLLTKTLPAIRRRHYDVAWGERMAHSFGISAPVFGPERGVIGSLSISIPKMRFKPNMQGEYAELIMAAARELSQVVGAD